MINLKDIIAKGVDHALQGVVDHPRLMIGDMVKVSGMIVVEAGNIDDIIVDHEEEGHLLHLRKDIVTKRSATKRAIKEVDVL